MHSEHAVQCLLLVDVGVHHDSACQCNLHVRVLVWWLENNGRHTFEHVCTLMLVLLDGQQGAQTYMHGRVMSTGTAWAYML